VASKSDWDAYAGIGLTVFQDQLYLAYSGTGSGGIFVAASADGKNWNQVAEKSDWNAYAGLGLTVFQDQLYLAYSGTGSGGIFVAASADGKNWNQLTNISNWNASVGIGLTVFQDEVYMAYEGTGSGGLYVAYSPLRDSINWMSGIADDKNISDINLPGTHDSAAINPSITTVYSCQTLPITQQLESGVRVLDVRIKIKGTYDNLSFVTCHGSFGGRINMNEYQSLPSLLDECKSFLQSHNTETILMSVKIDDWNLYWNAAEAIGLTVFQDHLYLAYEGTGSGGIYVAASSDGSHWHTVANKSDWSVDAGIGLAVFQNQLYMAYSGTGSGGIFVAASADGETWNTVANKSDWNASVGIGLTVFQNQLYMAYEGTNNNGIYVAASADGKTWNTVANKSDWNASTGIGLTVFQNQLYMAYEGTNNDGIYVAASADGITWNTVANKSDWNASTGIGLTVFQNQLYLAYEGNGGIYIAASSNGNIWNTVATPTDWDAAIGIGLSVFQSQLYMAYEGTGSGGIYVANSGDGLNWNNISFQPEEKFVFNRLYALLSNYKIFTKVDGNGNADIPTLGEARGSIYLFNRIEGMNFGVPLIIPDNVASSDDTYQKNFLIHIQDYYEFVGLTPNPFAATKLGYVTNAINQKSDGMIVWNFGSAVFGAKGAALLGLYINSQLIQYLDQQKPTKIGICFLDYIQDYSSLSSIPAPESNFISKMIDSNF
jgi:hypothetical protein